MPSKGKRTFWVTSAQTPLHSERCQLLSNNGFDVYVLNGIKEVVNALAEARPVAIIIDTPINDSISGVQTIQTIATMPEMNGVRFILSITSNAPEALRVALSENFRDVIPLNIKSNEWLQRFLYATGARATGFPAPLCELTMNQMAVALAPGRIIWINETHMRIECRGSQAVGTPIQLTGSIAQAFGVPHISLTVESVHKSQLLFRFSQALICKWRVAASQSEKASALVRLLSQQNKDARLRAFIAVGRPDIRKTVVESLNLERFDVKVALHKNTLAQELAYFSPDIVFIDERMLAGSGAASMQTLFAALPEDVPMVIYGQAADQSLIKKTFGSRAVFLEPTAKSTDINNAANRYHVNHHAIGSDDAERANPIPPDHPWSKMEILVPARLTSLNPWVGSISLPYSIGAFSLARLEAPILRKALGRDPYIKITDMVERTSAVQTSQFTHHGHFYIADVESREQISLGNILTTMLNEYYQKQFSDIQNNLTIAKSASAQTMTAAASANSISAPLSNAVNIPAGIAGNLALKTPQNLPTSPVAADKDQLMIKDTPALKDPPPRTFVRDVVKDEVEINLAVFWRKYVDATILKSLGVFLIAAGIMAFLISLVMKIDDSYYKDHGRQYSDFFLRMTDPDFRKKNPAPGMPKLDKNNNGD